jgi:hypothetical protein
VTVLLLAACGSAVPSPAIASPTPAPAVNLPPAWTATPSPTAIPETPTPSLTPPPAVVAARATAALWPPMEIVAVGAGADTADWKTLEFSTGSLRAPADFNEIEQRRFDDSMATFMQEFAGALVVAAQGEGTPAPVPASLDELQTTYGYEFLAAENLTDRVDLFLVAGPLPEGFDLETMLTQAAGRLEGEIEITSREVVGGAPLPTGRIFVRLFDRARGTVEDRVTYVVIDGDRAWTLTFRSEDFDRFTAMLPAFETSSLSLSPSEQPPAP